MPDIKTIQNKNSETISAFQQIQHLPVAPKRIDPQTASFEELIRLPGIGKTMAERIISFRKNSLIETPDDLLAIKGIGQKKLEKLRPFLYQEKKKSSN